MRKLIASLALVLGFVSVVPASHAETLQLVSTGGQSVNGENIYPYNFSVNGS